MPDTPNPPTRTNGHITLLTRDDGTPITGLKRCRVCFLSETYWQRWECEKAALLCSCFHHRLQRGVFPYPWPIKCLLKGESNG